MTGSPDGAPKSHVQRLRERFVEDEFLAKCAAVGPRSELAVKLLRGVMDAERLIAERNQENWALLEERNTLQRELAQAQHAARRFLDAK